MNFYREAPEREPEEDTRSIPLMRMRAQHMLAVLNRYNLPGHIANLGRTTDDTSRCSLISAPWVITFVGLLEMTIMADIRIMMRSHDFHARVLDALLAQYGAAPFEAAHALEGNDAIERLLPRSLLHGIMDKVDLDLASR